MRFIDDIFSFVWDISDWFYNLYLESRDIPIVGGVISGIFYNLYRVFWNLLTPIAHLGDWVRDVSTKVAGILSQVDIISFLRTWLTYAENAWNWVSNAGRNILPYVDAWWSNVRQTVLVWVNEAKQAVLSLVANVSTMLINLQTAWDNFRTITLPTLATNLSVTSLIDSKLKLWFPFYDDLVRLWGTIALFFTNPLDWLWDRFTDWFLGPE